MNEYQAVLDFWFGPPESAEYGRPRDVWFRKDEAFDDEVRRRFAALHAEAALGRRAEWLEAEMPSLALAVLLDQFPRNMYRGTPESFASDALALEAAQAAVASGFDQGVRPVQRWFFYLPFEHAENLVAQDQCVALFETLRDDPDSREAIDYAHRHREVIRRFGRFPHRNAILGRTSTPEELAFLAQPGSSF